MKHLKTFHNHLCNKMSWYQKYHSWQYHPHIHWGIFSAFSLLTTLKVLAIVLTIGITTYPLTTLAATQTWTSRSDWGNWTQTQTSSLTVSNSLALDANSTSWSGEIDSHVGSSAN